MISSSNSGVLGACMLSVRNWYRRSLHFLLFIGAWGLFWNANAQWQVLPEVVQRGEFLQGYGKPAISDVKPAYYIGQRTRIKAKYQADKIVFYAAIQDVRTWGNTAQVKLSDGMLSVHEAWVQFPLAKQVSVKVGRQELDFDGGRFLGNLDWALQGRAHDFLLFQFQGKDSLSIQAGGAWNQENQTRLQGNYFSLSNQYKTAQLFRIEKVHQKLKVVLFLWNDGLQTLSFDKDSNRIEKIRYTQTFGIPNIQYSLKKLSVQGFYYQQVGIDGKGKVVKAMNAGLSVTSRIHKWWITGGAERISGNSQTNIDNINRAYNPMYGTNHRHNGYMDYFYVGNRFLSTVGIYDFHLRTKYEIKPELFISLNIHKFNAAAEIRDKKVLGEIRKASGELAWEGDLTAGWVVNSHLSLQAGYSYLMAQPSLLMLSGLNTKKDNHWTYVMMVFRPGVKNKFIGLQF